MTEHYYSAKPTIASKESVIEASICGMSLSFTSDQGVFSKNGIDFGSRLLVETIIRTSIKGESLNQKWLDLGCGYGAMGLSLAKYFQESDFTLVDINERAVELSRKNANKFGLSNVDVFQSDGLKNVNERKYHKIFTNPPIRAGKQMIHRWFEEAVSHLETDGQLWIVIQKKQGAPSALEKLEVCYSSVDEMERDKGYFIYRAIK